MRGVQAEASAGKRLFAQRSLPVGGLVDAARLWFGHYEVDKSLDRLRDNQTEQIGSVDIRLVGPGDQFVRLRTLKGRFNLLS